MNVLVGQAYNRFCVLHLGRKGNPNDSFDGIVYNYQYELKRLDAHFNDFNYLGITNLNLN
jgi:hypothetical protein